MVDLFKFKVRFRWVRLRRDVKERWVRFRVRQGDIEEWEAGEERFSKQDKIVDGVLPADGKKI